MLAVTSLIGTILVFWGCRKVYTRWKIAVLSPIFTTFVALVILLFIFHVSYSQYETGAKWLTALLQPATVGFAIPLYKYFHLLKRHALEIVISVVCGSLIALVSSAILADWLHLGQMLANSLAPRSITTPIAMDVSRTIGGAPILTAVFVILTALAGLILAPLIIDYFNIRSSVAKGTLLGMGAHGIGTSAAFEIGSAEGTFASLAMIIAGGITGFLAPYIMPLIHKVIS